MKTGRTINALAQQVLETTKSKKDYALDTRSLTMNDTGEILLPLGVGLSVIKPNAHCLHQVGARAGIPRAYVDRMQAEAPALLAQNVNHWWKNTSEKRMLRTYYQGDAASVGRAFLSHRYRPLDNEDLLGAILPQMQLAGCEILSCEVTDKRLYIQARTPKIEGEVKKGDVIQAGVVISNSEVGSGSIRVEPMLYRLVCLNGMVMSTAMKKHHIGRGGDGDWDSGDAFEVFSDKTRQLDDKAFWAKVSDVMKDSVSQLKFDAHLAKLRDVTKIDIGNPVQAVEVVTKRFGLQESETETVLEHLARGADLSLWGLANAVTRTAEDVDSYDRAMELERMGGDVIELTNKALWKN